MEKLDVNSFREIINKDNFDQVKINDTNYLNISSIVPQAYTQYTLQNRIFILLNMFICGGLIDNGYGNIELNDNSFESLDIQSFISSWDESNNEILFSNCLSILLLFNVFNISHLQ